MTYMKPLSGHSSTKWIRYYLFKNDRALDKDFLNLTDRDWKGRDWAKVMDRTREIFGNNVPVKKDAKVRTYEHIIISLDEKDNGVELDDFRDFVNEWASKWFDSRGPEGDGIGRFEVAIAYHDDNKAREAQGKQGILHAHIVINNTELETKRRISGLLTTKVVQAMGADIQSMSLERGWHAFATDGKSYTQEEMDAKGLQVSRGKRLNRAIQALDMVLDDESKGVEHENLGEAMMKGMSERHAVPALIPETFDPRDDDQTKSSTKHGFTYTTMRTDDGRVMELIVPRGFGDSDTTAERQFKDREGWSWKNDIRDRVDVALRVSTGPEDFARKLTELGVTTSYNRDGELVYHHSSDPAARKVKDRTLGDEYTLSAITQAMAEKSGARRQRAHNLPGRERWMKDEERLAAMTIAKAAKPCTREGTELMSRLVDAVNDIGPNAIDLARSLSIDVPKPAPRRKPRTEEEIIAAAMDYRDEMGYGGNSLGSTPSGSTQPHRQQGSEQGGEARTRGVGR